MSRNILIIAGIIWIAGTGYHAGKQSGKRENLDKQIEAYNNGYERCKNNG